MLKNGCLSGIKVLDLTNILSGPFATKILGDLGAEIYKIEKPDGGDITRENAPFVNGESHYFLSINRNKKSICLNLKNKSGIQIIYDLVEKVDVMLESFRPGVVKRLGIDYENIVERNKKIIYCSISSYGQYGSWKERGGFDIIIQALCGGLHMTAAPGGKPVKMGIPYGDIVGGIYASIAIEAALLKREKTGEGDYIDISLLDSMLDTLGYLAGFYYATGDDPKPIGSFHPMLSPYGAYGAKDGSVIIAAFNDRLWEKFAKSVGLDHLINDSRFNTLKARSENRDELNEIVHNVISNKTVKEWCLILDRNDVPNSPVLTIKEALSQEYIKERDMEIELEHWKYGKIKNVNTPFKFRHNNNEEFTAPPVLGEHTDELLSSVLNYSSDKIRKLKEEGATTF